ncbi:MAG: hypothetical protein ACI9QD_000437, partial [Thermoproteota archaeon]
MQVANIYLIINVLCFICYMHIALTFRFSLKYLNLVDEKNNFEIIPLAFSFSLVCIIQTIY